MRCVLHLSDLHFGRTRPDLLEPLLEAVDAAGPDLVVISGDLTQRARRWQFREARQFLDRLSAPWLAVPGNHDVPLHNPALRALAPFERYRRLIARDLEPRFVDEEIAVVGVNSVDPASWQRGRVGRSATARATALLKGAGSRLRLVVAHHPFEQQPGVRKRLMRGAARSIGALGAAGVDVVLSGHLHTWQAGLFAATEAGTVQVHAGTGLSTRLRGEENDYNLLSLDKEQIEVRRFAAGEGTDDFREVDRVFFHRGGAGWEIVPDGQASGPVARGFLRGEPGVCAPGFRESSV